MASWSQGRVLYTAQGSIVIPFVAGETLHYPSASFRPIVPPTFGTKREFRDVVASRWTLEAQAYWPGGTRPTGPSLRLLALLRFDGATPPTPLDERWQFARPATAGAVFLEELPTAQEASFAFAFQVSAAPVESSTVTVHWRATQVANPVWTPPSFRATPEELG